MFKLCQEEGIKGSIWVRWCKELLRGFHMGQYGSKRCSIEVMWSSSESISVQEESKGFKKGQ